MRISFNCAGTSACCYYIILLNCRSDIGSAAGKYLLGGEGVYTMKNELRAEHIAQINKCFNFRIFLLFFLRKHTAAIIAITRLSFGVQNIRMETFVRIAKSIADCPRHKLDQRRRGEANKRNDFLTHPFLECNRPILSLWQFWKKKKKNQNINTERVGRHIL